MNLYPVIAMLKKINLKRKLLLLNSLEPHTLTLHPNISDIRIKSIKKKNACISLSKAGNNVANPPFFPLGKLS